MQTMCPAVWDPPSLCRRRTDARHSRCSRTIRAAQGGQRSRQAERRQGREAAGGAARSEAERGWSTVRKGACRQARKCIAGMRPPEGPGTGKCHRQKMILFCRLGTRYREPAACDHRCDGQATYPYNNQSAGKDQRSSEPRGAGPPMRYQSSRTGGWPYDPAASGDTGRCTRKQAGINHIAWAGAGERRRSRSEPRNLADADDTDYDPEQSLNNPDINLITSCYQPDASTVQIALQSI